MSNPVISVDKVVNSRHQGRGHTEGSGEVCCWLVGWSHSSNYHLPNGGKKVRLGRSESEILKAVFGQFGQFSNNCCTIKGFIIGINA